MACVLQVGTAKAALDAAVAKSKEAAAKLRTLADENLKHHHAYAQAVIDSIKKFSAEAEKVSKEAKKSAEEAAKPAY